MFTLDGLVALLEISRVCGAKVKNTQPAIWRVQLSLLARIDHDVNDVRRYRYLW